MMGSQQPNTVAVIMAGGAGTRFWPLSTEAFPKQFLTLFGERSLLQQSYDRLRGMVPPERVLVLTNRRFVPMVMEQLPELPAANIVGEPMRRDTAAAVVLAALVCRERHGDPVMAVLTADHRIEPVERFQQVLGSAVRAAAASDRALYTFGVVPTYPATGYGYLELGDALIEDQGVRHHRLRRFVEKPRLEVAQEYLAADNYMWNSGMFVWRASAILAEAREHIPQHVELIEPAVTSSGGPSWEAALTQAFEPLSPLSIDFGVMEHASEVRCVCADFDWNDVGGWLAVEPYLDRDGGGNAVRGQVRAEAARRNLVFCREADETVALVGVNDLVVVRAGHRTLITRRDNTEAIKALVKGLEPELR